MLLTYTKMGKVGTRYMHVLGLPTYLVVITMVLFAPTNFFFKVVTGTLLVLIFQYAYCKSLSNFNGQNIGGRFFILWAVSVLTIQVLILGSIYMLAT